MGLIAQIVFIVNTCFIIVKLRFKFSIWSDLKKQKNKQQSVCLSTVSIYLPGITSTQEQSY